MSEIDVPSQRKRTSLKRVSSEATQPELKRQKLDNHSAEETPAHYLDTLSKVWLTKEALGELDRRTRQARPLSKPGPQRRRPLTRGFRHELRTRICSTSTPASEFLKKCCPESLRKVKLSARYGGPDLLDLRGHPEIARPSQHMMSSSQSSRRYRRGSGRHDRRGRRDSEATRTTATSTAISKTTRSSGAYNPNFEQRMIDNGIFPKGYEYPDGRIPPEPDNFEEIQQMLAKPRASLSPSVFPEAKFREFVRADDKVTSENRATKKVIPMIQGMSRDERCVDGDVPFNNLATMMRGKSHMAKPDVFYGARPEQLNTDVRNQLSATVVPSTTTTRPIAPNFFLEAKRPGASAAVALNQACFSGAVGARGIHSLLTFGENEPKYDNKAHALSNTYHAGQLKMYTHHSSQPNGPGTDPVYFMNQIAAVAMTGDLETFRKGITVFRNGESWAEAERNAAIEHANAFWLAHQDAVSCANAVDNHAGGEEDEAAVTNPMLNSISSQSSSSAEQSTSRKGRVVRQESDTSADELALDFHSTSHSTSTSARGKHTHKRRVC